MSPLIATPEPEGGNLPVIPFPNIPEAQLGLGALPASHVQTAASEKIKEYVLDFLQSRGRIVVPGGKRDANGWVVAILGTTGSGKTHLANYLISEIVRIENDPPIVLLDSARSGDTVLDLYRRLLSSTADPGIEHRAADALHGQLNSTVVEDLVAGVQRRLAGPPAPPAPPTSDDLTVRQVWELRTALTEIVGDRELANAFGLLWHEFAGPIAWRWLRGADLTYDETQYLRDRGVSSPPVDGETRAMAVLEAVARLSARAGTRTVLVVDEIHRLRLTDEAGLAGAAEYLTALLTWADRTDALLVFCGRLDYWQALPASIHTRAPTEIRPSGLTATEIEQYIRLSQRSDLAPEGPLEPFTARAQEELFKIANGQPRLMITICHLAYRASQGVLPVGPEQIRAAARELSRSNTPDKVKRALDRHCAELGFGTEPATDAKPDEVVKDLLVRSRGGGRDVAIVISPPVLTNAERSRLTKRADQLSRAGERMVVLVVAGVLSDSLRNDLESHFSAVLRWGPDDLLKRLTTILRASLLEQGQTALYDMLVDLRREVRELKEGAVGAAPAPPDDSEPTFVDPIRADVHRKAMGACREALDGLHQIRRASDEFWRERFRFRDQTTFVARKYAPGKRGAALADLIDSPVREARGILGFVEDTLREFTQRTDELLRDESRSLSEIFPELSQLRDQIDYSLDQLISRFPEPSEDPAGRIVELLGVDKAVLLSHVGRLGASVYGTVRQARLGE
jgi:Cdc6-like AAA superfamily ATPase